MIPILFPCDFDIGGIETFPGHGVLGRLCQIEHYKNKKYLMPIYDNYLIVAISKGVDILLDLSNI